MTGSKHNQSGTGREGGEPDPGPYWKHMHRDWRFWVGAFFMISALAIYVLSGDLAGFHEAICNSRNFPANSLQRINPNWRILVLSEQAANPPRSLAR